MYIATPLLTQVASPKAGVTSSGSGITLWGALRLRPDPNPAPPPPATSQEVQKVEEVRTTFGPILPNLPTWAEGAVNFFRAHGGWGNFVDTPCVYPQNAPTFMRNPNMYANREIFSEP